MNQKIILTVGLVCLLRGALGQTEVITNGGFEGVNQTPWYIYGAGCTIGGDPRFAASGSHYLTLGSVNNASQRVSQTITIPTNATVAVFTYKWAVLSGNNVGPVDQLRSWIFYHSSIVQILDTEWNTSARGIYFQQTYDFSNFIGQTLAVEFFASTSPSNGFRTTFYIDDVSLLVGTTNDVPVNDAFTNRIVLSGSSVTNRANNAFATKEPGEPDHGTNSGGRSLWWSWTAPTGGTVALKTTDSSFATLLGVYTGDDVSNLTQVASQNGYSDVTARAQVKFKVSPGTEYQIAVDGVFGNIGNIVLNLAFTPDTKPPTVAITSPASGATTTNSTVIAQGTAADDIAVARVEYRLENPAGTNAWQIATGTNTWSAAVTNLMPGLNVVRARSVDTSTNVSATVARSLTYLVMSPLTLTTNGNGIVLPNLNGKLFAVGSSHTLSVRPGAGYLFSGWTGGVTSSLARLTFVMQSNLVLQANFIPNPFIPIAGSYQGLFCDTNGVAVGSAGFVSAALRSSGAFSAKFLAAGKSAALAGTFALDGSYSNSIARSPFGPLSVRLQFDLAGDSASGWISASNWTAQLLANRAVYSRTAPAPQAAKYTLLIPGADESEDAPGGDSFGTATVDAAGHLGFSGLLADGTRLGQKTFVSRLGWWPFYFSLNRGKGLAFGWLVITNTSDSDIDGTVSWIRLPQASKFYTNGFTNLTGALASKFAWSNGVPLLNVNTGQLWIANGNLPAGYTNPIVLLPGNRVTGVSNSVNLTLSTKSGTFKGSVPNPTTGARPIAVNGVVLQKQNYGAGYFSGTNQIGRVYFGP